MRKFKDLPVDQQEEIQERFFIPGYGRNVEVSEKGVPFERVSGYLVGCTVKNTNFHVHGNKQNGRS